jgi:hypothetical protein
LREQRRHLRVDAPVARFVGIGQRTATDPAAEAQVVELIGARGQTVFDVAQALAKGQLREGHAQKLIPAREGFELVMAPITLHTPAELLRMDPFDDLRKNRFSREHASRIRDPAPSRSHPF